MPQANLRNLGRLACDAWSPSPVSTGEDELVGPPSIPHPEKPAQRASRRMRMLGRIAGGVWFETRGCAALLTMRDEGRAGSRPAVTIKGRSPDGAQRNPEQTRGDNEPRISLRSMRATLAKMKN